MSPCEPRCEPPFWANDPLQVDLGKTFWLPGLLLLEIEKDRFSTEDMNLGCTREAMRRGRDWNQRLNKTAATHLHRKMGSCFCLAVFSPCWSWRDVGGGARELQWLSSLTCLDWGWERSSLQDARREVCAQEGVASSFFKIFFYFFYFSLNWILRSSYHAGTSLTCTSCIVKAMLSFDVLP